MSTLSIVFGFLLSLVGLIGFVGTGSTHYTALIPCALGLLLIMSGVIARSERLHMHAMHVAVLVSLIGFIGTASSLGKLSEVLHHIAGVKTPSLMAKEATAILCGLFFILCVRSFVKARLCKKGYNSK